MAPVQPADHLSNSAKPTDSDLFAEPLSEASRQTTDPCCFLEFDYNRASTNSTQTSSDNDLAVANRSVEKPTTVKLELNESALGDVQNMSADSTPKSRGHQRRALERLRNFGV